MTDKGDIINQPTDAAAVPVIVANGVENGTGIKQLETAEERQQRLLSLKIVYFTMFLISLGFSIVLVSKAFPLRVHYIHYL